MKTSILMLLAMSSLSAQAGTLLTCTTPGDALSEVKLTESAKGTSTLVITFMDQSEEIFSIDESMNKIKKGAPLTIIAAKDFDAAMGGEIQNAAMLQVLPGQKAANLAYRGSVFVLNCSK
jgi:hypothetical protein